MLDNLEAAGNVPQDCVDGAVARAVGQAQVGVFFDLKGKLDSLTFRLEIRTRREGQITFVSFYHEIF